MQYDRIKIEIFRNIFQSICDEMGNVIKLSAFSPNIKERNDFSCALFLKNGESFGFGSHIPVHLGSMPLSVKTAINNFDLADGDMLIMNDPFRGGTHLPDITLIAPFYHNNSLKFYIACRAHHSDIGGMEPGSMPLANEIYQEGLIIPPVRLISRNKISQEIIDIILSNVRTPVEREGDIRAQIAGIKRGRDRLFSSIECYGISEIEHYAKAVIDYTDTLFRIFLNELPNGTFHFEDYLDDDGFDPGKILISLTATIHDDNITFDFSGSSPSVQGSVNANMAVTYSCVLYCLISLFNGQVPVNSGIMRAVNIISTKASIVNAEKPSAVAGGNVETSQRITDVILGALSLCPALKVPAASQGTMNNISIGGRTHKTGPFTYYETIGGGSGAYDGYNGLSGVHTHMTNSLNTPVEVIESNFPIKIKQYLLRTGSGGNGKFKGGEGIIRHYECNTDLRISLLSERRKLAPYGLKNGKPGKPGENTLLRDNGLIKLPSKVNFKAKKGDIIMLSTPGGGGYGEDNST